MQLGETISTGASDTCPDCNQKLELKVCCSAAGYYIGTECCGIPNSRESGYFRTESAAETALSVLKETGRLINAR